MASIKYLRELVKFRQTIKDATKSAFGNILQREQVVTKTLKSGKKAIMSFDNGEIKESKIFNSGGELLKIKKYNGIGKKHSFENLQKGILNKGKTVIRESGYIESSDGIRTVIFRAKPEINASNPKIIKNLTNQGTLPINQIIKKAPNKKPIIQSFKYNTVTRKNSLTI